MSEALKEIEASLDHRYDLGNELCSAMAKALNAYTKREGDHALQHINIPRCSKEHLTYIVKELTEYTEELHRIRCELPRLLRDGSGLNDND